MARITQEEASSYGAQAQDKIVAATTKLASELSSQGSLSKEQFAEKLATERANTFREIQAASQAFSDRAAIEGNARKAAFYQNMSNSYADLANSHGVESVAEYNARIDAAVLKGFGAVAGVAGDMYSADKAYEKYSSGDIDGASATLVGMLVGIAAWSITVAIIGTGPVGIGVALIVSMIAGDAFEDMFPGWEEIFDYYFGDNEINPEVNGDFNSALNFIQLYDPLTLDLDGDGIETVSANTGITFDFDGDGLKTGTGWIKGDDGFLVWTAMAMAASIPAKSCLASIRSRPMASWPRMASMPCAT